MQVKSVYGSGKIRSADSPRLTGSSFRSGSFLPIFQSEHIIHPFFTNFQTFPMKTPRFKNFAILLLGLCFGY